MAEDLEYKTKEFMERFIGPELARKLAEEQLSILDTLKLGGIIVSKIATPVYGDKLMIDGIRLEIEKDPQNKNFYLTVLGIGLIGKYIAMGSAAHTIYLLNLG